jgi:glyoxylase-like metal-dependent hydrolase (beta-lactamase superfamily II)
VIAAAPLYNEFKKSGGDVIMTEPVGIKPLRLEMNPGGHPFVVHAAILWDEKDVVLVDTGLPGQLKVIQDAFAQEQIPFEKLTKIIITHQDRDHIGGLPELAEAFSGKIEVLAHELAKPYIQGETPLLKSGAVATPVKVDVTLQDGELLPFAGGVRVIHTPGHTPDHISLYHAPSKTLITGDALTSKDGVLAPPDPKFTLDLDEARLSVARLLDWDIDTVITYHGGVCNDRIKERLAEIASNRNAES